MEADVTNEREGGWPNFQQFKTREADAYMFVHALHHLRMAVLLVRRTAKASMREKIDEEIGRFDEAVPDVKKLRNALAHFDEYVQGEGNLQRNSSSAGLNFTYYSERLPPYDDDRIQIGIYVIKAKISPDLPPLEVEVVSAGAAAFALYENVLNGFR